MIAFLGQLLTNVIAMDAGFTVKPPKQRLQGTGGSVLLVETLPFTILNGYMSPPSRYAAFEDLLHKQGARFDVVVTDDYLSLQKRVSSYDTIVLLVNNGLRVDVLLDGMRMLRKTVVDAGKRLVVFGQ